MKIIPKVLVTLFLIFQFSCTGKKSSSTDIAQLDWLIGHWNRINTREDRTAHERWVKVSDKELKGWGVSMNGTDTTFIEMLSIILKGEDFYYIADVPENPEPVYFRFTEISQSGFSSENQNHDFPKKIQYELNGDSLTAITSGDGKELLFSFAKSK